MRAIKEPDMVAPIDTLLGEIRHVLSDASEQREHRPASQRNLERCTYDVFLDH